MMETNELIQLINANGGLIKGASFVPISNMFQPLGELAPYGECVWQASTSGYDDDDDIIESKGTIYKGSIKKLPLLWCHDPAKLLGRGENMIKGAAEDGTDALFLQFSYAHSGEAQEKRKMVEEGFISGGSVRVTPLKFKPNTRGGLHVTECELKEFSLHPMPRNTNTKLIYAKGTGQFDKDIQDLLKSIRKQAIADVVANAVNEYLQNK